MVAFTRIGQVTSSTTTRWQPVTTRASVNEHFTDPNTGAVTRNAIPQVTRRFGRSFRRVLSRGVRQIRLEWRNTYVQTAEPGETPGPNPVTLRASIEYPAGAWRHVNGTTAWSSTTAYNPGDQVTHGGSRWVATQATTAGHAPSATGPWLQVRVYPVHWAGQDTARRVTAKPGETITSQPVDLGSNGLLDGLYLAVNMLATPTTGGRIISGGDTMTGDFALDLTSEPAPGSPTDPVDSPITTQTNLPVGTPIPMPTVVEGDNTRDPHAIAAFGDSLFHGLYDTPMDGDAGGFVPRALRSTQMYRVAVAGARADSITSPTQTTTWRNDIFARCGVVLTDLGGNDAILGDGTTNIASNVAMVKTRMTALWRHLGRLVPHVWATTITPWTMSNDGWRTLGGQSISNNIVGGTNGLDGVWGQIRDWLADEAPINLMGRTVRAGDGEHPLTGICRVGYAVIDPATGWKWRPGITTDGLHPDATGHAMLAAALRAYLPALRHGSMTALPTGSFEGHWSVPFANEPGGGESLAVSAPTTGPLGSTRVNTLTRTVTPGVGCTMDNGIFTPLVSGLWSFSFATQWMGGSNSIRAMFLREIDPAGTLGDLGTNGIVSDSMSTAVSVRLRAGQRVGLHVANWTRGTTVRMWNAGMTNLRATWEAP